MPEPTTEETILKYERLINDVLKEDLRKLEARLVAFNKEVADLVAQRQTLKVIGNKEIHPDGFKTQVNIGCNFFMEARVLDTSVLLMNIGLNHHLEFTIEEAIKYLDVRIKAFEEKVAEIQGKASETQAHIKLMLFAIGELHELSMKGEGSNGPKSR